MVDPIAPTRDMLSAFFNGDMRMVQAIERLFLVSGQLTPEQITELAASIEALGVQDALRPTPVEADDVLHRNRPAPELPDVLPVHRVREDAVEQITVRQRQSGLSEQITVAVGQVLTIENGLIVEVT